MSFPEAMVTISFDEYNHLKDTGGRAIAKNEGFCECLVMIKKFQANPTNQVDTPSWISRAAEELAKEVLGIRP